MNSRRLVFLILIWLWVALNAVAAKPEPMPADICEDPRIFHTVIRKPGDDGSKAYRIPGLVTKTNGTLLSVFDIRYYGSGDLPENIDVGLMRSTDNGESWSSMRRILDFGKSEPNSRGNGVGDPVQHR